MPLLADATREMDSDYILYMDGDALISYPWNTTWETILSFINNKSKEMNLKSSNTQGWWNGNWSRFVEDPDVILTKDVTSYPGLNSGVNI
jgi:hypothetical protein